MSSSASIKQRQLRHLNSQFQNLETNLSNLESLLKITKLQADSIRKLGLIHGSLFMSAHKVFYDQETNDENTVQMNNTTLSGHLDTTGVNTDYNESSSFVIPDEEDQDMS